ncbi:hypothetical protein C8Q77DRAFT_1107354 [Trametes polyzona]|nr:hypothetical protein C8Q77DRAFT_1107354 [Trametes polyzona]
MLATSCCGAVLSLSLCHSSVGMRSITGELREDIPSNLTNTVHCVTVLPHISPAVRRCSEEAVRCNPHGRRGTPWVANDVLQLLSRTASWIAQLLHAGLRGSPVRCSSFGSALRLS